MMRHRLTRLAAAALMAAFLLPEAALSQALCAEREAVLAGLVDRFGEIPAAAGLAANGAIVELLVSPSGSWTLLISRPDGLSCLITGGDGWGPVASKLEKESAL